MEPVAIELGWPNTVSANSPGRKRAILILPSTLPSPKPTATGKMSWPNSGFAVMLKSRLSSCCTSKMRG